MNDMLFLLGLLFFVLVPTVLELLIHGMKHGPWLECWISRLWLVLTIVLVTWLVFGSPQIASGQTLVGNYQLVVADLFGYVPQAYGKSGLLILTPQPQIRGSYVFSVNRGKIQSGAYVRGNHHYRAVFVNIDGEQHFDQLWWLGIGNVAVQRIRPVQPKIGVRK